MHVVIIARHYAPTPGAATNRISRLVGHLLNSGCEVTVITRQLEARVPRRDVGEFGEAIVRVAGDSASGVSADRALRLLQFAALAGLQAFRTRADLLIVDPPPNVAIVALVVARVKRLPFVYYMADSWGDLIAARGGGRATRLMSSLLSRLDRALLRFSTLVAFVSTGQVQKWTKYARRSTLVQNGVPASVYGAGEGNAGLTGELRKFESSKPYFLYAGNYGEAHDSAVFIEAARLAWAKGLEFDLLYVGYGSDAKVLSAKDSDPRLRFSEPVPVEDVAAALRGATGGLASVRPELAEHAVSVKALATLVSGSPLIYVGGQDFAATVTEFGGHSCSSAEDVAVAMAACLALPRSESLRQVLSSRAAETFDSDAAASRFAQDLVLIMGGY